MSEPVLGHASFTPFTTPVISAAVVAALRPAPPPDPVDTTKTLAETLEPVVMATERRYLIALLELHEGKAQAAATTAGISRRTLLRRLIAHKINRRDFYRRA